MTKAYEPCLNNTLARGTAKTLGIITTLVAEVNPAPKSFRNAAPAVWILPRKDVSSWI